MGSGQQAADPSQVGNHGGCCPLGGPQQCRPVGQCSQGGSGWHSSLSASGLPWSSAGAGSKISKKGASGRGDDIWAGRSLEVGPGMRCGQVISPVPLPCVQNLRELLRQPPTSSLLTPPGVGVGLATRNLLCISVSK